MTTMSCTNLLVVPFPLHFMDVEVLRRLCRASLRPLRGVGLYDIHASGQDHTQVKVTSIKRLYGAIKESVAMHEAVIPLGYPPAAKYNNLFGGLRRCWCLMGLPRGLFVGGWVIRGPGGILLLPHAWLDATLQLIERTHSSGHPYLHGIARSTDEHSEHDGYRVDGHAAGVLVRWRTKIAYGVLK